MTSPSPDLAGYKSAQHRLIDELGSDVTFHFPDEGGDWPEDTILDPETGEPYDPTIEREDAEEVDDVELRVGLVSVTGATADETTLTAFGITENTVYALLVKDVDFASIAAATTVTISGEEFLIADKKPDPEKSRYVLDCESTG